MSCKDIEKKFVGQPIFKQLIDLIPKNKFDILAQETQFALDLEKAQLTNKINAQKIEIQSLSKQRNPISGLVNDNNTMLQSEERLFTFG